LIGSELSHELIGKFCLFCVTAFYTFCDSSISVLFHLQQPTVVAMLRDYRSSCELSLMNWKLSHIYVYNLKVAALSCQVDDLIVTIW